MSTPSPFNVSITHPDGRVEVLYEPTPKQREYHAATEPNVLFEGSRGTGKSHAARWDFHMRALATPGFKYVITRRTYPELNKTHLLFIDQEMKKLGGFYHKTNRMAMYPNGSIGFFAHCETEQDVLNLLGAEFHAILIDEATTFPFEWITKLASSCRVLVGSGLVALVRLTTNPLGESVDDIWRYYVDKDITVDEDSEYVPSDYGHVHTILTDNPYLDTEQYKKRFAGLPEHVKRAWLDGERMISDALFDFRRTKNGKPFHEIIELPTYDGQPLLKQPWVRFYRAYDAGYFPDPAYCLWIAVVGRQIIPFKEKVWLRKTAEEIARDIVEETKKLDINVLATFCDPSINRRDGSDVYTVLDKMERCGLPLEPAVNDRELFAAVIHSALKEEVAPNMPRVQILASSAGGAAGLGCPYLLKSLPAQKFDPKKPMAMAAHKHDHPAVTFAYFLMKWASEAPSAPNVASRVMPWMKKAIKSTRKVLGNNSVRRPR